MSGGKRKHKGSPGSENVKRSGGRLAKTCHILPIGFSERELEEMSDQLPTGMHFSQLLTMSVSHIVWKPALLRTKARSNIHLYAALTSAWILRPAWIEDSIYKAKIQDEDKYQYKAKDIDLNMAKKKSDDFTAKDAIKLCEWYAHQKVSDPTVSNVFCDDVFRRVLVTCRYTTESRDRRRNLLTTLEAGGGTGAADNALRQIKEKPRWAPELVSAVILLNGEKLEDAGLDSTMIRRLILQRIPVLYEDFLFQLVRNKLRPDGNQVRLQSVLYWQEDDKARLKFSEEMIKWIATGEGTDPNINDITNTRRNRKARSCPQERKFYDQNKSRVMDDSMATSDSTIDHTASYSFYFENLQQSSMECPSPPRSDEEIMDTDRLPTTDFQLSFNPERFGTALNGDNKRPVYKWTEWRGALRSRILAAVSLSGMDMAGQAYDSQQKLESIMAELPKYMLESSVHSFICNSCNAFLRNSSASSFLPHSDLLANAFRNIALADCGSRFEATDSMFRLLLSLMERFPPVNEQTRYYWLKVFSTTTFNKKGSISSNGLLLKQRIQKFRKLFLDVFTQPGYLDTMQEVLLQLIETDLYAIQGCGIVAREQSPVSEGRTSRSSNSYRAKEKSETLLLKGKPLAFLVFFEYDEHRRRGLDEKSRKLCTNFVIKIAQAKNNILEATRVAQALGACLEAVRWMSDSSNQTAVEESLSYEMNTDIKTLIRYSENYGLSKERLLELVPVKWLSEVIDEYKG